MASSGRCERPDHSEPRLKCGAPLPCQYHTVILDISENSIHLPAYAAPMPKSMWDRLSDILASLREEG